MSSPAYQDLPRISTTAREYVNAVHAKPPATPTIESDVMTEIERLEENIAIAKELGSSIANFYERVRGPQPREDAGIAEPARPMPMVDRLRAANHELGATLNAISVVMTRIAN